MILLFLQFYDLKSDLILANLFCSNILLSFQLFDQKFGIVGLMIDFLISTFLFNLAQIDNVLSYSDPDRNGALKVLLHLDKLEIMVHRLQVCLLLPIILLVLGALGPLNSEILDLGPVLLINLIS